MNETSPPPHRPDWVEQNLARLGLALPPLPVPAGSYVPVKRAGNLLFTASLSAKLGSDLRYLGRLGTDLTVEQGYASARHATLTGLAVIKNVIGRLEHIRQVVRLTGYVNSAPDFFDQHLVMNGASELLLAVFEAQGQHVRAALGVAALPMNCSVGIELTVEINE